MPKKRRSEENEKVKNRLSKLESPKRVVAIAIAALVVIAIVVVVFAKGGKDSTELSLCGLVATDTAALLADDESDTAIVAEHLRDRAKLIESARSGQEATISNALRVVSDSLRQLADATVADDGGKQLQELTSLLTKNAELQSAQLTIYDAISAQCEAPITEPATSSTSTPGA